jgi:3'-phosphoadenosine 5'-phosphosulfate sulfotransferase (PAPS reductase)/FAD synthetase|nr:MAG TPA_asm: phosphoadenosine-phosphosulfate reductase [Caudoviricetes sp.]
MKHIIQISGGKDSVATSLMLIKLREENKLSYDIDEAVFFDTGMEFQVTYETIETMKKIFDKQNIKFSTLHPKIPFEEKMFNIEVHKRNGTIGYGYSWCGGVCRWGTTEKLKALEKHCAGAVQIVGLAYDEQNRIAKERNGIKAFPMNDWKMTEADALKFCYESGIEWKEDAGAGEIRLYDVLDRVSCWCCGNKNLKELRNMYLFLPNYWERLKELQSKTDRPFRRDGKTIFDLEERFKREVSV